MREITWKGPAGYYGAEGNRLRDDLNEAARGLIRDISLVTARQHLYFYMGNVGVSLSDCKLYTGLGGARAYPLLQPAFVTGMLLYSDAARTAGTLTVEVLHGSTQLADTVALDGTNTQQHLKRLEPVPARYIANAGAQLSAQVTTDASWAPTTANIVFALLLEYIGEY